MCEELIADCRATGGPVVIVNLIYTRPGEDLGSRAREDAVIEAARALSDLDVDLLKLEYPGSPEGCRRLSAVLDRPWAVLSAGVPFDQFTDVIRIAADEGGASGFIAGRSVWREVVSLTGPQREEFLTSVALPRLEKLVDVAVSQAPPVERGPLIGVEHFHHSRTDLLRSLRSTVSRASPAASGAPSAGLGLPPFSSPWGRRTTEDKPATMSAPRIKCHA